MSHNERKDTGSVDGSNELVYPHVLYELHAEDWWIAYKLRVVPISSPSDLLSRELLDL